MDTFTHRTSRILLSTVSSDSHTWNLVFLQMLLEEAGHEVINLGSCVPDDVLLDAARSYQPDVLVISSVNGHGNIDGSRVMRKLRSDPETSNIPAVIGGKLGIKGDGNSVYAQNLMDAGFGAVFTESSDTAGFDDYLVRLALARADVRVAAGSEA